MCSSIANYFSAQSGGEFDYFEILYHFDRGYFRTKFGELGASDLTFSKVGENGAPFVVYSYHFKNSFTLGYCIGLPLELSYFTNYSNQNCREIEFCLQIR